MCAMMQKFRTWSGPLVATADSRWITFGLLEDTRGIALRYHDAGVHQLQDDGDAQEGEIEAADGRDDAAHRGQDGFDQHSDVIRPASAQARNPRDDGIDDHHQHIGSEDPGGNLPDRTHDDSYTPGTAGSVARMWGGTPLRYGAGSMGCPS